MSLSCTFLEHPMTPLPRWVLLAIPLAPVVTHPAERACVHLRRAHGTSAWRSAESASIGRGTSFGPAVTSSRIAPSSGSARLRVRRCRLALDCPIVDGSPSCRAISRPLVQTSGLPLRRAADEDGDASRNRGEEETVVDGVLDHGRGSRTEDTMKIPMDTVVVSRNTGTSVEDSPSTDEESIDWELWCMGQCDMGQGGSGRDCDIIP